MVKSGFIDILGAAFHWLLLGEAPGGVGVVSPSFKRKLAFGKKLFLFSWLKINNTTHCSWYKFLKLFHPLWCKQRNSLCLFIELLIGNGKCSISNDVWSEESKAILYYALNKNCAKLRLISVLKEKSFWNRSSGQVPYTVTKILMVNCNSLIWS